MLLHCYKERQYLPIITSIMKHSPTSWTYNSVPCLDMTMFMVRNSTCWYINIVTEHKGKRINQCFPPQLPHFTLFSWLTNTFQQQGMVHFDKMNASLRAGIWWHRFRRRTNHIQYSVLPFTKNGKLLENLLPDCQFLISSLRSFSLLTR